VWQPPAAAGPVGHLEADSDTLEEAAPAYNMQGLPPLPAAADSGPGSRRGRGPKLTAEERAAQKAAKEAQKAAEKAQKAADKAAQRAAAKQQKEQAAAQKRVGGVAGESYWSPCGGYMYVAAVPAVLGSSLHADMLYCMQRLTHVLSCSPCTRQAQTTA
jgi:hypothetical protein